MHVKMNAIANKSATQTFVENQVFLLNYVYHMGEKFGAVKLANRKPFANFLLDQVHSSLWLVHTWLLKISFLPKYLYASVCVCMCVCVCVCVCVCMYMYVCVCVSTPEAINN